MLPCINIFVNGVKIDWVMETRYLGIFIKSGHKLKFNFENS
jgi:hypothetical protein